MDSFFFFSNTFRRDNKRDGGHRFYAADSD